MEPIAAFAVDLTSQGLVARAPRGRHRRAATSLELRLRLVRAIAATVYAVYGKDRELAREYVTQAKAPGPGPRSRPAMS